MIPADVMIPAEPRPLSTSQSCRLDDAISEDDPRVVAALEEYMSAIDRGLRPDRREFLRTYAELAPALSPCLDGVDLLRRSRPDVLGLGPIETSTFPRSRGRSANIPDRVRECTLAEFQIVREVGRGGMGVVYEAVRHSTGEHLALKVMPYAASLDHRQRLRFRTEVSAAGRLDHPNIVPVVAMGAEREVPFYVMPLIDGECLASRVRRHRECRPLATRDESVTAEATGLHAAHERTPAEARTILDRRHRATARLALQAARALEHAHGMGVLHRDIKPANLLVDGRGRLYVTDFGLARTSDDLNLTISGDLVGTLRYMSPEQALGRRGGLNHQSDVYSLGATLYELLTLQPMFAGQDAAELLRMIAADEPTPPRKLDQSIPRPLEAIVLKAIAKAPSSRYEGAGAMADDLERFLQDQPIRARGASVFERGRCLVRSHRRLIASAAAGLAILLVGFQVGLSSRIAPAGITESQGSSGLEIEGRSHHALELALQAVDELSSQLETTEVEPGAVCRPDREGPWRRALELYHQLAELHQGDRAAAHLVAVALVRAGDIGARLQEMDDALKSYAAATCRIEELIQREPEVLQHRLDLASTLNRLGHLLRDLGRLDEAAGPLERSLTILEALAARFPHDQSLGGELSSRKVELAALRLAMRLEPSDGPPYRAVAEVQRPRTTEVSASATISSTPSCS